MNTAQRFTALLLGMVLGCTLTVAAAIVGVSHAEADGDVGTAVAIAAACKTDEGGIKGHPCYWDHLHRGNGKGHSFFRRGNGDTVKISHARAHCMTRQHEVGTCPGSNR